MSETNNNVKCTAFWQGRGVSTVGNMKATHGNKNENAKTSKRIQLASNIEKYLQIMGQERKTADSKKGQHKVNMSETMTLVSSVGD